MNVELEFANTKDRAGGWRLDPGFLREIANRIEEDFGVDEDIPSLEQIEMTLLTFCTKDL